MFPPPPRPPADALTPARLVTHEHFTPGDHVVIIKGAFRGELVGQEMTVVAPSWHTPTDEAGWRLRNPRGGEHSYVTAHPRYMIHTDRYCPDCTGFFRSLSQALLPRMPESQQTVDGGWYYQTTLDQLVHTADLGNSR
ncbi:hypothetical protein VSR01_28075 [Actinacidiphila sp. DG2A-62]|uniref:hypothetical protein n=1 Tax=Actinacidiphila sp. DG2A-62 TaxID=3108821 RepID=UPI002DB87398|nr:hypothetical protein [Actinacidiphila sp. DG2A-62]MEC3997150.1 hypothetical protein [Actinacidiphila sp. DG2A-62]